MKLRSLFALLLSSLALTPTALATSNLTFGAHYAVLVLDCITALVDSVNSTTEGQAFIASTAQWISAVHAQTPAPLTIFTRIYFSNPGNPELGPTSPFAQVIGALLPLQPSTPASEVYSGFPVRGNDTVLQKTRFYAGAGNALEEILRAQHIDTVVLSGLRTSGVILDTVYHLYDLDYDIYVVANNTIETPVMADNPIQAAILGSGGIVEKLGATVITIEAALEALNNSGPAVY